MDQAQHTPEYTHPDREARPYFCRECQKQVMDTGTPAGWYGLTRNVPNRRYPHFNSTRLGLFCSVVCLQNHLAYLHRVETIRDEAEADDAARSAKMREIGPWEPQG